MRGLSVDDVLKIVPVSKCTLYREIKAGRFPAPSRLSAGRVCWIESEVQEWLTSCIKTKPVAVEKLEAQRRGLSIAELRAQSSLSGV